MNMEDDSQKLSPTESKNMCIMFVCSVLTELQYDPEKEYKYSAIRHQLFLDLIVSLYLIQYLCLMPNSLKTPDLNLLSY